VLIVDDHRGVLDSVSAMLADDFAIAGIAADGVEALEVAGRSGPDLIVLDINMPRLDGFRTLRALQQAGSQAPVVFLSMHDSDEHVAEAFRCGGHGYVLKSRAARDLPIALRQAQLGRRFAPSLRAMCELSRGRGHDVQVRRNLHSFLEDVATLFDLALRRGDATCVIASGEVRDGLSVRLRARGWKIGGADADQRYVAIDAAEALGRFMRNGLPDAPVLAAIAADLENYRRSTVERETSRLTIFGHMSELLMAEGNPAAAVALESLWHRLTRHLPFYTLCAYDQSCFDGVAPDFRARVYAEHEVVGHASGV
jgi:DNA-binding NarL/FixJ family response regulator